jgi:hypothetical protein
MKRLTKKKG